MHLGIAPQRFQTEPSPGALQVSTKPVLYDGDTGGPKEARNPGRKSHTGQRASRGKEG